MMLERTLAPRCCLRVEDAIERELHVAGGERPPVVELHALAELERPRLAVGAGGPRFGEDRLDLEVAIEIHQALVDEAEDLVGDG